jgi:uncharacterized protein
MTTGANATLRPASSLMNHPAVPYVLPFAVFILLLGIQSWIPLPQKVEFGLRIVILSVVLWYSRRVVDLGVSHVVGTVAVGLGVFVLWIAPDLLFAGYRQHWLFHNFVTGSAGSSLRAGVAGDPGALALRSLRAILIVPIVEELFWRGWLMRYLIRTDFLKVPLGAYSAAAFWTVALLFAAEHGPYWDVGLLAGIVYNWWMCRTKRLGDLIWAHAITNAALCAYVLLTHKWEYWL